MNEICTFCALNDICKAKAQWEKVQNGEKILCHLWAKLKI